MEIFSQANSGFTVTDPSQADNPLIYVNDAFVNIFGYTTEEVVGKNCRFLQGDDREQEAVAAVKEAIANQKEIIVTLRNYTKSGELIYNEVTITPIFDRVTGKLKYFFGVQKVLTKF